MLNRFGEVVEKISINIYNLSSGFRPVEIVDHITEASIKAPSHTSLYYQLQYQTRKYPVVYFHSQHKPSF